METWNGQNRVIHHLLSHCGGIIPGENVLIICDQETPAIATAFAREGSRLGADILLAEIPKLERHGLEPPLVVAAQMLMADLIISLCHNSLAHSQARIDSGARFLSLPHYNMELLRNPCVMVDYIGQAPIVQRFADAFTNGSAVRVGTRAGTNVTMDIRGRQGNACPGFVRNPGDLGSPPDIEANVAPIETSANGFMVADSPDIALFIRDGRGTGFFETPSHSVLAECGVGLNPLAKLCGNMLVDEGVFGAVHFGFGSNRAHGGQNETDFHLDCIMVDASLWVDDVQMLNEGKIC